MVDVPGSAVRRSFSVPVPLLFITLVAVLLLLFIIVFQIRTTEEMLRLTDDTQQLLMLYNQRNSVVSLFAVVLITAFASVAILAYGRYERRLERLVEERTGSLLDVLQVNQEILDNSPIGILKVDVSGVIVYASPAMRGIAGVESEKVLIGLNVLELESTRDAGLLGYFTMGLAGRAFDVDGVVYRSQTSGKRTVRHYRGVPLRDARGGVRSLLLIIEDVTDRRRAEEEVKWIINGTSTPMFVIDTEHRVRFWNRAMEELTGLSQENVVGTKNHWKPFFSDQKPTLADLLLERDEAKIKSVYSGATPSRLIPGAYQFEDWMMDGFRYLSVTAAPIFDPQGQIVAAVQTIHDLTDVAISEERYKNMVDNANDLIMILNTKGEVVFSNNRLREMFGYAFEDVVGVCFTKLLTPPDAEKFLASIAHACEKDSPIRNLELKASRKDGSEFYVELSAGCIRHGPTVTGLQLVIRDVTERRKADEIIRNEFARLKELDEMKDDFISITAHEMKTPLISILNIPDMMLEDKNLTGEQREGLRILLADGRKLKTIIDRILTESRLRSGKIVYDFTSCSVLDVVTEQVLAFERRLKEKELRLEVKVPGDLPPVRADVDLLGEVLTNLIDNAIKFTKGGVDIVVGAERDGDFVKVWVRDSGIGISEEHQVRLFDKFYQVEHRDDRQYGGTGLGLHICRQIIEKHGGRIWVESKLNVGSTFYFTLPIFHKEVGDG